MIDYEDTSYIQIIEKDVNVDKTFSFQELGLDFAFGIYDFNGEPFAHMSEQDYAGYIEKPIVNIMDFDNLSGKFEL